MTRAQFEDHQFVVTQEMIDTYERDGAVMLQQPFGPGGVDSVSAAVMDRASASNGAARQKIRFISFVMPEPRRFIPRTFRK